MTTFRKLQFSIVTAIFLLVTAVPIALMKFYKIKEHLIGHSSMNYELARLALHDAKVWIWVLAAISIVLMTTIFFSLLTDVIKPFMTSKHMEKAVKQGLLHHEFELVYQPQLDLKTNKVVSAEALLRWHHPKKGNLSPDQFITQVEKTQQLHALGAWTLKTASQQFLMLKEKGILLQHIAINLSAAQLTDNTVIQQLKTVLNVLPISSTEIQIEITESVMMENRQIAVDCLHKIRALGMPIALDDFGTGHSSLSYLKDLPIQTIKIDRVFVQNCEHDATDQAILKSIIEMARGLKLSVIAEGVENDAQRDVLRELGCDVIQGYLVSKPLGSVQLTAFLAR